jgi:hypothetical protein
MANPDIDEKSELRRGGDEKDPGESNYPDLPHIRKYEKDGHQEEGRIRIVGRSNCPSFHLPLFEALSGRRSSVTLNGLQNKEGEPKSSKPHLGSFLNSDSDLRKRQKGFSGPRWSS